MPASSQPARAGLRLEFLDLLRGTFILLMIEGHTMRALLPAAVQQSWPFRFHELIHNLTGPACLFASGAAFVYSTRGRWESYRCWSPKLKNRLLRWGALLVLGYSLQLTYGSLGRSLHETTADQLAFLASLNILQCIVFSLMALQLTAMLAQDWGKFLRAALCGAIGIALATPFAWNAGEHWPLWVGPLISGRTLSFYPVLPYAAFSFAGAVWGYLHSVSRERNTERRFLQGSARVCALLGAGGILIACLPLPAVYADFWNTSPLFFFVRVGILGLLSSGARIFEHALVARLHVIVVAGRQSLLVYVTHLVVLYGSAFNPDTNLVKALAPAPVETSLAALVLLIGGLIWMAVGWERWKRGRDWQVQGIKWTLAAYFAYMFFTG